MKNKVIIILLFAFYSTHFYCGDSTAFKKGKIEFLTGNYTNALNSLLAFQKTVKEIDVNYFIAMSYFNLKKYPNAIVFFSEYLKKNKNNINSYMQRAQCYGAMGKYSLAFNDLRKALKINKDYFLAYYEKGNLKFHQKKFRSAIEEYNNALVIHPNFENAFYQMGYCYINLKDTIEACKSWKKIEDLDDFENYEKIEAIIKNAN